MLRNTRGARFSRILVVDDDILTRELMMEAFDHRKYQVETLPSGLQLTEALEGNSPDLIILDVSLPWKNGFDLCHSIKSDVRWKNIPVLFMTARRANSDRAQGREAGADGYLTKPFTLKELTEKVSELLH